MQAEHPDKAVKIRMPLRSIDAAMIKDLQEKYPEAEVSVEIHPQQSQSTLSEAIFWAIIAKLDWKKKDDMSILEPAVQHLAGGPLRHIFEFADILSEKLFLLDGVAYAKEIGEDRWTPEGYFSADNFLYARCCVVANGQAMYEQILEQPTKMPKDLTFEALLYLPSLAYERRTGNTYDYIPSHPVETFSNEAGWNLALPLSK